MDELEQFKEDFERDYSAQEDCRDAANEDMRFVSVDGGQWEGWLEDEDRTKLEFDITSDYVDRFLGRYDQEQIGVKYSPGEGDASEEDAELLTGLFLKDYNQGDGEISQYNAIQEAITCGFGAWRFVTVPIDEEDPESPLRIVHRPIYSSYNTVVWDSGAKRQDKSDARHCTVLSAFTREGFKREYGEDETPVSLGGDDRAHFNWVSKDTIYVGERYHVERKPKTVFLFINPITRQKELVDESDVENVEDDLFAMGFEQSGSPKKIIERRIIKSIFHGNGFLEKPKRIPGKHIPVPTVYGKYGFVDGQERYRGMVRKLKDSQRIFNLMMSTSTDDARETNRDLPIFAPEQVDGLHAQFGEDKNKLPFLQVRPLRDEVTGQVVQTGPLGMLPARQIDANTANLINMTAEHMDRKTGSQFMNTNDPDASGEAKREARKDVELTTAYLNKGIRIAMKRAGEIYMSMAQEVYADQRRVKVMNEDGTERFVNLMEHVMDEETGVMVPVHDITKGKFDVVVKAGPQYESAREATVETLKEILTNLAQGNQFEAPVMATLMANLPGVGIDELREMAKREMLLMGMRKPETDEDNQILQQAAEQQDGEQEQLIQAVTEEQRTQAQKNFSEVLKNMSQADLNKAKAQETRAKVVDIGAGIKDRRMKLFVDQAARRG